MYNAPTGTVTFLFTDIEGSTKLWDKHPDAMKIVVARHDVLLRGTIENNRGYVFKTVGDAFCAAFPTALDALSAALGAQRALRSEDWGDTPIKVRMALHSGNVEERDGDYLGRPVNRVARLLSAGHGGQILVSLATSELLQDDLPQGISLRDRGEQQLKDLERPEHIFQLVAPDLPTNFPPLKVDEAQRKKPSAEYSTLDHIVRGGLVGRVEQVKRMLERLDAVKTGIGGMVLLSGEPGIGKTRLLNEAIDAAKARGYQVLIGRCHERDIAIPYVPIADAIETYARNCAPKKWERLLQEAGPEIQALLSDSIMKHYAIAAPRAEAVALVSAQREARPGRAVRKLLLQIAKEAPVVFVIDDLHWADPPTLELVHDVALYTREMSVLILGGYREIELERTHPLSRLLVDLNRERVLVREHLRRFSLDETRQFLSQLLGRAPTEGLSEIIHEQTEGNPFFIEELVIGVVERERLRWSKEANGYELAKGINIERLAGEIPQGVRAAIGSRLDRLDPDTQQVLALASVIGRHFASELLFKLAEAHGLAEEEVDRALATARAARFIHPLEINGEWRDDVTGFTAGAPQLEADYTFEHSLVHQVVYAELERRHHRALHAEVGRLLEESYVSRASLYAERIAFHYLESANEAKALEYSILAGNKILRSYYDADMALGYFLLALDMVVAKEPALHRLGARSPIPIRRGAVHHFTPEEREAVIAFLGEVLRVARESPSAKSIAELATRICLVAMHTDQVYQESIRLYEQCILGPNVQKVVVETERGKLVGILEFPGSGGPHPVVLMFHGSLSSKEVLADRAQPFLARGMATLRVDLPGYGETTVPLTLTPSDAEILKEIISALLKHERVDSKGVGIIGWSLGPWHATQLAARDPRVRAVVSISGMFDPADPRPGVMIPDAISRAFQEARLKAGQRPSLEMEWSPDASVFGIAHQIRCPMLLVYGALEPERFRDQAEKLASLVPTAKKQVWRTGVHVLANIPEALENAAEWMKQQLLG